MELFQLDCVLLWRRFALQANLWEVPKMPDEIIEELWRIKDSIAQEHGNDVRKLAAYLQGRESGKHSSGTLGRSAVDILNEAPGGLVFKTAKEVDDYIKEERASWDR